tara:strand:+ start:3403 stop:4233 length:831 start_codon:yes stop_codon:yes gene_type:complete
MEAVQDNARATLERIGESSLLKPIVMGILAFLAFIFVMYMLIRLFDKKRIGAVLIEVPVEPKSQPFICTKNIVTSDANETTYSFWTYIKTWSQSDQTIFESNDEIENGECGAVGYVGKMIFKRPFENDTMYVTFAKVNPELIIYIKKPMEGTNPSDCEVVKEYKVEDIRLQTWNHFVISLWGKTMDIYLNGQLVRTFVIDAELFPKIPEELVVGAEEGKTYDGYISRFTYYPRVITPQEVKKLYYRGPAKKTFAIFPSNPIAKVNMSLSSNAIWNQ